MERTEWGGWHNCIRLSSGAIDMIATTDIGVNDVYLGNVGGDAWRIYRGHRLWHAPEAKPRTYAPDNSPVMLDEIVGGIVEYFETWTLAEGSPVLDSDDDIITFINAAIGD